MAGGEVSLPPELEDMLLNYVIRVLIDNPEDLPRHAADYFAQLRDGLMQGPQAPRNAVAIQEHLGDRGARRASVAAERYDPDEDTEEGPPESFPKGEEERSRIRKRLADVFLFRVLDDKDLERVIEAMEPRQYRAGDVIIREGDDGDFYYVVDCGHFEASTEASGGEAVATYDESGSFGELALLHNQPRSATVTAVTDGALWAVSRNTFRRLVIKRAHQKRRRYLTLLGNVTELKPLTEYERMQVADALQPRALSAGRTLFKEGDDPDGLYFVESGRLSVTKLDSRRVASEEVNQVGPGDYVGELALVTNQKRSATITALVDSKLAFLERKAFERLLGSCLEIMKRKTDTYRKAT